MLSPPTTNVPLDFASLHSGDIQVALVYGITSIQWMDFTVISEYSGQSGGETPVPIPNTAVKPAHVLHCTQMCELSGTAESCYAHLLLHIFLYFRILPQNQIFCKLSNQISIKNCHEKPQSYWNHKRQSRGHPNLLFNQTFFR